MSFDIKIEKGITLVALVITIIILLILAGIAIASLIGQGLFEKSKLSKIKTEYTSAKEIIEMKLMEVQTECVLENKDYKIEEIAQNIVKDSKITIEKCYYENTSSIKDDIEENFINLKGIVVSVDQYSKYKFLIGKSCEIEGVTKEDINYTTSFEEDKSHIFETIQEFEDKLGMNTSNNNEANKEDKYIPELSDNIDISNPIEITTYMAIKTNTINTLNLTGIENPKYELKEKTDNISVLNNILTSSNRADSNDYCKIQITGIFKGQSYTNNLIVYVEPKNTTTVEDEEGNKHNAYAIYTPKDLVRFAELINHKVQSIENVAIMNEINLEGIEWVTIGDPTITGEDEFMYKGIFDGKGNTIKNLTISKATKDGNANFIRFMEKGIIKDLNIDNIYIYSEENTVGLIGQGYNGTIIDNVKILSGEITTNKGYAAGIGSVISDSREKASIIRNCYNNATISAKEGFVGGICSFQWYSTIENCQNDGKIKGNSCIGGICGLNTKESIVKDCINNGQVEGIKNVGGICGQSSSGTIIENCKDNTK